MTSHSTSSQALSSMVPKGPVICGPWGPESGGGLEQSGPSCSHPLRLGGPGVSCNVCSCNTWGYRVSYKTLGRSLPLSALGSKVAFSILLTPQDKVAAAVDDGNGEQTHIMAQICIFLWSCGYDNLCLLYPLLLRWHQLLIRSPSLEQSGSFSEIWV